MTEKQALKLKNGDHVITTKCALCIDKCKCVFKPNKILTVRKVSDHKDFYFVYFQEDDILTKAVPKEIELLKGLAKVLYK